MLARHLFAVPMWVYRNGVRASCHGHLEEEETMGWLFVAREKVDALRC